MTSDELRNLPMYSTVKIDYGPNWQFTGVLVAKWMPADVKLWQGHIYIEKHNGQDYHGTMWGYLANMSIVGVAAITTGLNPDQKSKLANAVSLVQEVIST